MANDGQGSSILCTASIPGFDPTTRDLTLISHHLLSSPHSIAASFHPSYRLLLERPPEAPYQSAESAEVPGGRRRKRRKLDPELALPADWASEREKESKLSTADRETRYHHSGIEQALVSALQAVRDEWGGRSATGWIGDVNETVHWAKKQDAEETAEIDWVGAQNEAKQMELGEREPLRLVEGSEDCKLLAGLLGRVVFAPRNSFKPLEVTVDSPGPEKEPVKATLVLPPSSAFLLSDFSTWSAPSSSLASTGSENGGWDLLLLDPPWPNASANRAAAYDTFDAYDLWKLDVKAILGDKRCLIAVWLTNKVKFRRLVSEKLFPAWGVKETSAEWYWIKVSAGKDGEGGGEPMWKMDGVHRKCYEGLVLGYYNPTGDPLPPLPREKIFISTPLGHSRKPVIFGPWLHVSPPSPGKHLTFCAYADLLRPFLPNPSSRPPNVLELFARTALAGPKHSSSFDDSKGYPERRGVWLSVGNEAVKFNVLHSVSGAKGWLKEPRIGGEIV
ncbi:hypothetical protein P7C70_g29, partial [Phenoliferia sp. Uapishka_3]